LPQQVYIYLPEIEYKTVPSIRLKHFQAARERQACLPGDATRLHFVQKNEVGRETPGQKNSFALARAEALACPLQ
jgi:hypothetical protein